jgi:hypothetical protein
VLPLQRLYPLTFLLLLVGPEVVRMAVVVLVDI